MFHVYVPFELGFVEGVWLGPRLSLCLWVSSGCSATEPPSAGRSAPLERRGVPVWVCVGHCLAICLPLH